MTTDEEIEAKRKEFIEATQKRCDTYECYSPRDFAEVRLEVFEDTLKMIAKAREETLKDVEIKLRQWASRLRIDKDRKFEKNGDFYDIMMFSMFSFEALIKSLSKSEVRKIIEEIHKNPKAMKQADRLTKSLSKPEGEKA
jgi:sugar-specific transcriptional regulator TrmB